LKLIWKIKTDGKKLDDKGGIEMSKDDEKNRFDFLNDTSDKKEIADNKNNQPDNLQEEQKSDREFDFDIDKLNEKIKNIFIDKAITDEEIINKIKERISKYSNEIPHHDLTDFGDKIKIISAKEKPSYKLSFQTHYEKRELHSGIRPYHNEDIPPKLITKDNVDIWSFDGSTKSLKEFEEKEESWTILSSQEVFRCGACKGHGEIRCSSCAGRGEVKCPKCDGRGYVRRINLDGGHNLTKIVTCYYCGGSGRVTCSYCGGSGMVTCSTCAGEGRIVEYLYFDDIFKALKEREIINNADLPQDIISGNSINIHTDLTPSSAEDIIKTEESISNQDGNIIFEFKNKFIPDSILDSAVYENIKSVFKKLLSDSKNVSGFGVFEKDYKILKQEFIIKQINVIYIEYKFADKNYSLWIYGKDNSLLYAEESPIQEFFDNYLSQSRDLLEKKEYSKSLEFADKCILMKPKDEKALELKKIITAKIRHQYWVGGLFGGLFFLPIALYYSIQPIGAIVLALVMGFVVGVITSRIHSIKIKKVFKRYLIPIIYSFCISALTIILLRAGYLTPKVIIYSFCILAGITLFFVAGFEVPVLAVKLIESERNTKSGDKGKE
jgi:hypothetical protein